MKATEKDILDDYAAYKNYQGDSDHIESERQDYEEEPAASERYEDESAREAEEAQSEPFEEASGSERYEEQEQDARDGFDEEGQSSANESDAQSTPSPVATGAVKAQKRTKGGSATLSEVADLAQGLRLNELKKLREKVNEMIEMAELRAMIGN
jgi:hypothetical protein